MTEFGRKEEEGPEERSLEAGQGAKAAMKTAKNLPEAGKKGRELEGQADKRTYSEYPLATVGADNPDGGGAGGALELNKAACF